MPVTHVAPAQRAQFGTWPAAALLALAGCSAPIVHETDIGHMTRQEVSAAIEDCETAGQRATVVYARAEWKGHRIPVPVDVQCLPTTKFRR